MNKAVVFDLDGTIYYGNTLADNAKEALSMVEDMGYKIIFLTNNSTKTRYEICTKLINLDINANLEQVYTSASATAKYLKEISIKKVFLIGTNSFKKELNLLNIDIVSEEVCEAIVIGLDMNFNYDTIAKAFIAVQNGAKIIASNMDANYPVEDGVLKPGSNAILASLLGSCERKVDYIVGKPNTYLLKIIAQDWDLSKDNIWVIGDGMDSDIAMANNYGCKSILVGKDKMSLKDAIAIIKKGE